MKFRYLLLIVAVALLVACSTPPAAPTTAPAAAVTRAAEPTKAPEPPVAQATATPARPAGPKKGGTLIAARAADMKGLDPHKQTAFASFRMLELIYDTLFIFDKDLKVVGNLAESWKFSEDGKTLTVSLRKNVKFHNGDAFTSDDVKFSFERVLDEKTGAAARATFSSIDSMETPDANTIVFKLKTPNVAILAAMTSLNSAILSKKAVSGGSDPAKDSNGTGAFKLDKWEPDKTLRLVAHKDFWIGGQPYLDAIEFRTIPDEASILAGLRAGQIDWALINSPQVAGRTGAGSSNLTVTKSPALAYHVLQLHAQKEPFTNLKVRQALACAIDRQEVLDTASLGEGQVTGPATPPFYQLQASDMFCYKKDLDRAKKLLSESGVSTPIKFKVIAAQDEPPTALNEAQNIQAQLKPLGIEVEIEKLELQVYVKRWLDADFQAAVALNGGNPDPDNMFYRYWHNTGNLNKVAGYKDDAIDKLLDQGRTVQDVNKRKEIYTEIQKKLTEAVPWVWLYVGYEYRVMQPHVQGFTPLSNGSIIYLRDAWLNK